MAPIVRICPRCGNYVTGVHEKSFGNKVARTGIKSVAKAGYAGTGAAIGSIFGPLGTIIGGAAGWAASTIMNESIEESAEQIQESTVGIDYTFRCPKCGNVWTGKEEKVTVWVDHNVCKNHVYGMLIHTRFTVYGMKGKTGSVNAYFFGPDDAQLKDFNGCYATNDGFVCSWTEITPGYDECYYEDLQLFMPYPELHFEGSADDCYLGIAVWCEDTQIMQSDRVEFNISNMHSPISLLPCEHGVVEHGENGMKIHVKFQVEQMNGIQGRVCAAFFYEDGSIYTYNGEHMFWIEDNPFTPNYDSCIYNDYSFHLPYKYFEDKTPNRKIFYRVLIINEKEEDREQPILVSSNSDCFCW